MPLVAYMPPECKTFRQFVNQDRQHNLRSNCVHDVTTSYNYHLQFVKRHVKLAAYFTIAVAYMPPTDYVMTM